MPKSKEEQLEEEILAMEALFSQDKPIDVALLIQKTKELTKIKEKESYLLGQKEGLTAGLAINQLKEAKAMETPVVAIPKQVEPVLNTIESAPKPIESIPQPVEPSPILTDHSPKPTEPVAKTEESLRKPVVPTTTEPRRYVRINDKETLKKIREDANSVEYLPPSVTAPPLPNPQNAKLQFEEGNLGKYVMGILAALLAITGFAILGAMVWGDIPNGMKAFLQYLLGTLLIFFPLRHVLSKEEPESNGFLNSVIGTGLGICYITSVLMGSAWGLITEMPLLIILVALILVTMGISYKVRSNTLLVVGYLGNLATMILLGTVQSPISILQTALILLLSVSIFLSVFTSKNDWVNIVTKICCFIWNVMLLISTRFILEEANHNLDIQLDQIIPRFYAIDSALFSTYMVTVFFAFLLSLAAGHLFYRKESFSWTDHEDVFPILAMVVTYIAFMANFYHHVGVYLLLFAGTMILAKHRANIAVMSVFFLPAALGEFISTFDFHYSLTDVLFCMLLCIMAFFLYFATRELHSYRYTFAVMAYSIIATIYFIAEGNEMVYSLPLVFLWSMFLYHGIKNNDAPCSTPYLYSYIPLAMMLSKLLHLLALEYDPYFWFLVPVLLLTVGFFSFMGRYFPWLQEEDRLQQGFFVCKAVCIFLLYAHLFHGRQEESLLLLQSVALLYVMIDLCYKLWDTEECYFPLLKPIYFLMILFGLLAWTENTALGEITFVISIFMLVIGCASIFLGFYQKEKILRHYGLVQAMLAVLKMVTVDISSSDSIVRVLALIVGAILCFLISCVYNYFLPSAVNMNPVAPSANTETHDEDDEESDEDE